jgi:hypothetical protein
VKFEWTHKERNERFGYLVERVNESTGVAERAAAARLLGIFAPFGAGQTKELRALLAATKDDTVAKELRALLGE